ncbi:MAG: glycosyltransferase family 4 protein [Candidatus Limnocylindria bacterium]
MSASPRVAFVMEQVLGHTTWSLNLRSALDKLGIEAVWVETSLHRVGGVPERVPGLPTMLRAGVRGLIDVRRGLKGQRYDALLFNTQKAAMLCQPYLLRTPTLLMTDVTPAQYDRMSTPYRHGASEPGPVARAKWTVNTMNFRLARALIGWSQWTARSLVDEYRVPASRVYVVPPGVDTSVWRPEPRARSARPRLLFVGGDFERKGGPALLRAFTALGIADRAELHIVTREEVPATRGVVVHRGMRNGSEALRRLYADSDAFVLPTIADCFSIAAIEAMAAGLPVAVTDVGGVADIVVDGHTGFLLPSGDDRALGVALTMLVDDWALRRRMGAAARERAVAHFDARDSATRILGIAASVCLTQQRAVAAPWT